MELDAVLHKIGEFGPYQRRVCFVICLVGVSSCFHNIGYVFWAARPNYWCASPDSAALGNLTLEERLNLTIPWTKDVTGATRRSQCQIYDLDYSEMTTAHARAILQGNMSHDTVRRRSCHIWEYDQSVYKSTIVTKWDLVCDHKWLTSTTQSVYMVGRILGNIIFGHLTDRIGRRKCLLASTVLSVLFSVGGAVTPEFYSFLLLRCLQAVAEVGQFMAAFIISIEIVGPSWRSFTGMMIMLYWAVGYMILALIGYLIRDCMAVQLALYIPLALLVSFYWLIPETPRWLLVKGRKAEAMAIIRQMAKTNNAELPDDLNIIVKTEAKYKATILDLVRTPFIRRTSFVLVYIWLTNTVVYYGLALNTGNLGGNDFVNSFIAGAVEVPAYMFQWWSFSRFGRRWPQIITMSVAGVALLATAPIPKDYTVLTIVLAMVGKCSITSSFGMIYVHSSEIYPTVIRTIGLGFCMFTSRLGGIAAPYSAELDDYYKGLPLFLFGVLSVLAALSVLLLPETRDKPLPQTLQDGEGLSALASLPCSCSNKPRHSATSEGPKVSDGGEEDVPLSKPESEVNSSPMMNGRSQMNGGPMHEQSSYTNV